MFDVAVSQEGMSGSAVCLLSLGSQAYDQRAMDTLAAWQAKHGLELLLIVLDEFEKVNSDTLGISARSLDHFRALVKDQTWPGTVTLKSATEIVVAPDYREIERGVTERYGADRRFTNLVRSQTFKSLHHRLHQLGIRNQRHPAITDLGLYLVFEFALLIYFHRSGVVAEVGFHERGPAADYLIQENLQMPPFFFLSSGAELPSLTLQEAVVRIPQTSRTIGPISVELDAGKLLGIIGPNGAGKSTLLRAIAGHLPFLAGSLKINGQEVNKRSPFSRRVSTVFQDAGLIGSLSGRRNISLGSEVGERRTGRRDERSALLVEAFDLVKVVATRAAELSIGERQLVALVRAAVTAPNVLLLDEPTASIDTARRRILSSVIRETVNELRIPSIIVSHDTEFLFQVCDEILIVDASGTVVAQGRSGDYVSGGSSFAAADLIGVDNVLKITDADDDLLVLDNWIMLPSARLQAPPSVLGIRISATAIGVKEATPSKKSHGDGVVSVRGVIRSRQYFPHGDFIMFEPIQIHNAGFRLARARGLMLSPGASRSLTRMHVDLLISPAGITWLS